MSWGISDVRPFLALRPGGKTGRLAGALSLTCIDKDGVVRDIRTALDERVS
jgi:hypothetical protein